ncbi:MAG TPA: ATP-binding cassette domain-containing protein [Caproicibacter sp.]|nr:ATP-binding cassette domain-containing protein [Caproicibacter sp.]
MNFEIQGITKNFGMKQVLKGLNLQTESGKAFGLLGRNGAGKTTTIRIIMGVFPPDGGTVLVDGKPIRQSSLNIGYLPEEHGLYPKKVISEQLVYLGELRGMSAKSARDSAKKWLERLGMSEYLNKKLDTLSKGNQQKIQLAAALITDPDFVILDEPFSGLDPVNAMVLKDVIRELIDAGKLVLFSSHQMNYVEEFCDSIAILNQGKIVLSGNIKEIKHSYDRSKVVATTDQAEQIAAFCRGNLAELVESADVKSGEVLIKMKSEDCRNRLVAALAEKDFSFDSIRVYEPSLNDIFVEYTEEAV